MRAIEKLKSLSWQKHIGA